MIFLKNLAQIEKLRKACSLTATGLSAIKDMARPGVSTIELDAWAENFCHENEGMPGFKEYKNYPYSICASLNSELIHGFPTEEPMKEGDILSVDFGVLIGGYYGDSAITIPIGKVSKEADDLIKIGKECLYQGIIQAYSGNRLNNISQAIQTHAEKNGYSVARKFVGHGVGRNLHEEPQIPNYTKKPGEGIKLKPGMVIAIEPMLLQYEYGTKAKKNGWTVSAEDGGLTVHWEHTVLITDKGSEILTTRRGKEFYGNPRTKL